MDKNINDKKTQLVIEDDDCNLDGAPHELRSLASGSSLSLVDLAATTAIDQKEIDDSKEEEEFLSFNNADDDHGVDYHEGQAEA